MEFLISKLGGQALGYVGGGIGGAVVLWLMKRIPNDRIKAKVGSMGYYLGVSLTLGLSKWSITRKFWNKTIEPYFVDLMDNCVSHFIKHFIVGLRSEN